MAQDQPATSPTNDINEMNMNLVLEGLKIRSSKTTSLKDALAKAIQNNPTFLAAKASQEASSAAYEKDFGALLPDLDLVVDGSLKNMRNDTTISRYTSGENDVATNREDLILSQLLWDGGATTGKVDASQLNAESSREQVFNTGEEVILKATQQYIDVLRYKGLHELSLQNVKTHRNIVSLTQDRYQSGVGNMADVAQAEASLSEANARALNAEQNLDEAKAAYARLFGAEVGHISIPDLPLDSLPLSLDDARAIAMNSNAAIKAAALGVQKREKEVSAAQGQFFPRVSLDATTGRSDNTGGYTRSYYDNSLGLNVNWNIFNGNSDTAHVTETKAQLREAQQKHEEIRRSIDEEVRNCWNFLLTTKSLIPELRNSVAMNEEALANYIAQFRLGRRTLLDVLSAEKTLYSAQQTLLNAYLANTYAHYRILMPLTRLAQTMNLDLAISDTPTYTYLWN